MLLDPDVASRTSALAGRLDAIPTLVDQAKENLFFGAGPWRSDGLAALALCRALLAELPQLLAERVPAYRVAELVGEESDGDEGALVAREPRRRGDRIGTSSTGRPSVPKRLERYFLYSEMVDAPAPSVLAEANEALAVTTDELTALALERFAGEPLPPSFSLPAAGRSVPERPSRERRSGPGLSRQPLGDPFPLSYPVPVVSVAPYFVAPDTVALFRPAALEPAKGPFLIVDVATPAPDERSLRLRTLGEVAVRFRQFAFQARSTSLLRRVFSTRTTIEGFRGITVSRIVGTVSPRTRRSSSSATGTRPFSSCCAS